MNNIKEFALNMIGRNPMISNNPNFREFIDVIRSGDDVRGQQIAENLCKSYGTNKEAVIENARKFFRI